MRALAILLFMAATGGLAAQTAAAPASASVPAVAAISAPAKRHPASGARVGVHYVRLFVRVLNPEGKAAAGLGRNDFKVFDDNRPVKEFDLLARQPPLRLLLLLDVSESMRGERLARLREAALDLLGALSGEDRVLVAPFSSTADFSAGWRKAGDARGAVRSLAAGGGTALYDAVYGAAGQFPKGDARRVILLLSDGRDERADGLAPGSTCTAPEALRAVLRADATLSAVGLGGDFKNATDYFGTSKVADLLGDWSARSGGVIYLQPEAAALAASFRAALGDLRQQYLLIFRSGANRIGEFPLRVDVPAPLRAFHRPAYRIEPEEEE